MLFGREHDRHAAARTYLGLGATNQPAAQYATGAESESEGWLSGCTKDGREYWYHPDNPRNVRMKSAVQPSPPPPATGNSPRRPTKKQHRSPVREDAGAQGIMQELKAARAEGIAGARRKVAIVREQEETQIGGNIVPNNPELLKKEPRREEAEAQMKVEDRNGLYKDTLV